MARIKITCDSTADLSPELYEKYDIDTVPLYIILDNETYKDSVDIQPDDIFAFVDQTGKLPKTAAGSIQDYTELFNRYANEFDAVIHFNIGEKFSSSHQNAYIASQNFENVYVVNSDNLSTGTGHQVLDAVQWTEEGLAPEEIVKRINSNKAKYETSFVIDTLEYLRKGGRCTPLQAIGANLLSIKPTIEVINGEMDVGKKYRGKLNKVLQKYVSDRLEGRDDIKTDRIFITHSGCSEETINIVKDTILQYQTFDEMIVTRASCTITCHCGPNTLGILFRTK